MDKKTAAAIAITIRDIINRNQRALENPFYQHDNIPQIITSKILAYEKAINIVNSLINE